MNPRWRNKKTWNKAGVIFTVAWFTYVAVETRGNTSHPLFDLIFLVPLGVWIVIVAAARILRIREPGRGPDA